MSVFDIEVDTQIDLQEPSMYSVILLNDDFTPMDFVIELLVQIFGHEPSEAAVITMTIHEQGKGAAGTYSFEVAQQKQIEGTDAARRFSHPLRIVLERIDG